MHYAWPVSVIFLALCAHAEQSPTCAAISGTADLWQRVGLRYVVVGEMHGATETPAIFRELVCSAFGSKRPIVVGVERRDQGKIDSFMQSGDEANAVRNLLSGDEWNQFDGRSSVAMLALLKELRAFKSKRLVSDVVAFAHAFPQESAAQGERRMAMSLRSAASKNPDAVVVVFVGNVHACKGSLPGSGSYPMMASYLPAAETVSLFATDKGGEAWNCQGGECGPHKLPSSGGNERRVVLSSDSSPLPCYDGVLSTGTTVTPSPPAKKN